MKIISSFRQLGALLEPAIDEHTLPADHRLRPLANDAQKVFGKMNWDLVLQPARRPEDAPEGRNYFDTTLILDSRNGRVILYTGDKDSRLSRGGDTGALFRLAFGLRCISHAARFRRVVSGAASQYDLLMHADAAGHALATVQKEKAYLNAASDALPPLLLAARKVIDDAGDKDPGMDALYDILQQCHFGRDTLKRTADLDPDDAALRQTMRFLSRRADAFSPARTGPANLPAEPHPSGALHPYVRLMQEKSASFAEAIAAKTELELFRMIKYMMRENALHRFVPAAPRATASRPAASRPAGLPGQKSAAILLFAPIAAAPK